jgi:PAS domain S-box-containing protein
MDAVRIPEPIAEAAEDLLARRVRLGLGLSLLSISLFALADLRVGPPHYRWLLFIKLAMVAEIAAAFAVLRRVRSREQAVIGVALFSLAVVYSGSGLSGVITDDSVTTAILCTSVTVLAATLVPWGSAAQVAAGAIAAAVMLGNTWLVGAGVQLYPAVGVSFGLGTSVYIAFSFERYRRAIAAHEAGRQSAERALRDSEAELRGIFDNLEDVYCRIDLDGIVCRISPSIRRYGYHAPDVLGRPLTELSTEPDLRDQLLETLRNAGSVRDWEIVLRRADGSEAPASFNAHVLRGPGGEMVGFEGLLRDMTARKQAETEIHRLNEDLRRRATDLEVANRELEAFSYSVAHDLRAPLRGIDSFSSILAEDYGGHLDEPGLGYLKRIRAAAQRMGQLIDDLLQLSRVARADLRRDVVDLSALVRGIVDELRRRDPLRRAETTIAANIVVAGDPMLLRVALENLLENAWKFTSKQESCHIEFGSRADESGETVYFVRDDGVGFEKKYAGKLFGAFQRLHSSSEFEGTGIGLASVERVIRRHRGRVWAESVLGQGATFYFTLGSGAVAERSSTPWPARPRRASHS